MLLSLHLCTKPDSINRASFALCYSSALLNLRVNAVQSPPAAYSLTLFSRNAETSAGAAHAPRSSCGSGMRGNDYIETFGIITVGDTEPSGRKDLANVLSDGPLFGPEASTALYLLKLMRLRPCVGIMGFTYF